MVDDGVVTADEEQVQLGEDRGLVVAPVADEGPSLGIARQIVDLVDRVALGLPDEQPYATRLRVPVIEKRLHRRSGAVDAVEVEPRSPEVDESAGVDDGVQLRRRVEGDVVIDELPQIGESRRDARVGGARPARVSHPRHELFDRAIADLARQQAREHPPEAPLRRIAAGVDLLAARNGRAVPGHALVGRCSRYPWISTGWAHVIAVNGSLWVSTPMATAGPATRPLLSSSADHDEPASATKPVAMCADPPAAWACWLTNTWIPTMSARSSGFDSPNASSLLPLSCTSVKFGLSDITRLLVD